MPRRETEADRINEQQIAQALLDKGLLQQIEKIPYFYTVDFAGMRDGVVFRFLEMKHRNIVFGEFEGGLFMSLNKVLAAAQLQDATGIPTLIVVRFKDGAIWWTRAELWDRERGVFWWGRSDRDDNDDEGPSVAFPWKAFRQIK